MTAEQRTAGGWPWQTHPAAAGSWLPLLLGLLVMAVPTIASLGKQTWSTEAGAHGPIVAATGLWLLHYSGLSLANARDATPWSRVLVLAVPAFALYIFGRAYDFISLEVAGLYLTFLAFLWRLYGLADLKRWAFPLFYLAFIIPPPGWVIDSITAPLQMLVSYAAAGLTAFMGYPIERQGVTLMVAQYQLLVEDACAGMNSLTGLVAVSLFYIYLIRRATWRYALLLVLLILPVAIIVNIIRVVALILITYYFGNEAAQGFLHGTTGLVLFAVALFLIFGADVLLWPLYTRFARR